MYKIIFLSTLLFIFTACSESAPKQKLDGKKLLESKCASCHNISMPPELFDDELAPPIMSVSFHVYDFVKPSTESQRMSTAVEFVVDYVRNPSVEKSFCDKASLKHYGLMPSQKENVSEDEATAIANYMFEFYKPQNLMKIQQEKAEFDALAPGKKLAIKHKCLGCHRVDKKIVGPSFKDIALRYTKAEIKQSIKSGTKKKWENSRGAIMPAFKQLSDEDLEVLAEWIEQR